MWSSEFFEFSNSGYFIPSFVIPGQQVTSDPCLDPLGLLYTPIREPCFRQTWSLSPQRQNHLCDIWITEDRWYLLPSKTVLECAECFILTCGSVNKPGYEWPSQLTAVHVFFKIISYTSTLGLIYLSTDKTEQKCNLYNYYLPASQIDSAFNLKS